VPALRAEIDIQGVSDGSRDAVIELQHREIRHLRESIAYRCGSLGRPFTPWHRQFVRDTGLFSESCAGT
jgi:hypothetical protein